MPPKKTTFASDLPDDHWSRNWKLFFGIIFEFESLRERYQLGKQPDEEKFETLWSELFGPDPKTGQYKCPNIRQFHREMLEDRFLFGSLNNIFKTVPRSQRFGCSFQKVAPTLAIRLTLTVLRNAKTWKENGSADDKHWARFWNEENLRVELIRSIDALRKKLNDCKAQTGSFEADIDPMNSARDHRRRSAPRPEDFMDRFETVLKEFEPFEQNVIRTWFFRTSEGDGQPEEEIADSLNITIAKLNEILTRFLKRRKKRKTA